MRVEMARFPTNQMLNPMPYDDRLPPCPRCGGKNVHRYDLRRARDFNPSIECDDCDFYVTARNDETCTRLWERASTGQHDGHVEA